MSEPLNLKLTTAGQTAIFNAQNNGLDVTLTHIQFGAGNRVPDRKETALVSPKQLATIGVGQKISDSQIRMSAVFIGASNYEVCEIGVWAGEPGSPDSVLFAYCSQEAGRYAVMSAGVDFVFSYDMSIDEAVGNVVKIVVDPNGSAMIALMASHEAAANPHPQYATHIEVATKIAGVVGDAPDALDTLGKVARKVVLKAGDSMTGPLRLPELQFNAGVDGDSASRVYNSQGKRDIVFRTGPAGAYQYSYLAEDGTLTLPVRPAWGATPWDTRNFNPDTKAAIESPAFVGNPSAPTPGFDNNSTRIATTEFVVRAISTATVGMISFEARTRPRAGYVELNGALLLREDYPELWAYAQGSGALATDAEWSKGRWGCFSAGDGKTTFRVPELRGEHLRCWDNGRGIDVGRVLGSWQDSLNKSHGHGATASAAPDHVHTAWTDTQGSHYHVVKDPGHQHTTALGHVGVVAVDYGAGWGPYNWDRQDIQPTSSVGTGIWIDWAGNHGHNVGIGGGGTHGHAITVGADGGSEARPRNVALLVTMRAY